MSSNVEIARQNMIENQVRPWEVLDPRVLDVLAAVRREDFVPVRYRNLAFVDMARPIGHGETMMKPTVEGRLLQALGSRHQVMCVTHLAQVAAFAGTQVVVEKAVERVDKAERTVAHATVVDGDERVAELSRMLAGVGDSSHARRHAAELLETAGSAAGAGVRRGRR